LSPPGRNNMKGKGRIEYGEEVEEDEIWRRE
jgi:hypothetical protein